jgi:hypothetical protein
VHHSYGSYAPCTYGSYAPCRANSSTALGRHRLPPMGFPGYVCTMIPGYPIPGMSRVSHSVGNRSAHCVEQGGISSGVITTTQPKVPHAKIRGSQTGFQWVIRGLERVTGVLKGAQRGPMGPPGPLALSALGGI